MSEIIDRKKQYSNERSGRWGLAKKEENVSAHAIGEILATNTKSTVIAKRYDGIWHEKFNPNDKQNSWVRGCPDFYLEINNKNIVYLELKIKKEGVYRKTKEGGVTKDGSVITKYGCESFYIDIEPVYSNMIEFAKKANIDNKNIMLAFYENKDEIRLITLAKLKKIVENGVKIDGVMTPLCKYGEGYGKVTYLIPKSATKDIKEISSDILEIIWNSNLSIPQQTRKIKP